MHLKRKRDPLRGFTHNDIADHGQFTHRRVKPHQILTHLNHEAIPVIYSNAGAPWEEKKTIFDGICNFLINIWSGSRRN